MEGKSASIITVGPFDAYGFGAFMNTNINFGHEGNPFLEEGCIETETVTVEHPDVIVTVHTITCKNGTVYRLLESIGAVMDKKKILAHFADETIINPVDFIRYPRSLRYRPVLCYGVACGDFLRQSPAQCYGHVRP